MTHDFSILRDINRQDDAVVVELLGADKADVFALVADAPSSAPDLVGRRIPDCVRDRLAHFRLHFPVPSPAGVTALMANVCVSIQDFLKALGSRQAVTNVAMIASCQGRLYYYLVGDSFLVVFSGRSEGRPRLIHVGETSVWNGRAVVGVGDEVTVVQYEGRKYLGEGPRVYPQAGDIKSIEMSEGDWYLLASDGLLHHVAPKQMLAMYAESANPADLLKRIQKAIPDPPKDDVTVALVAPEVLDQRSLMDRLQKERARLEQEAARHEQALAGTAEKGVGRLVSRLDEALREGSLALERRAESVLKGVAQRECDAALKPFATQANERDRVASRMFEQQTRNLTEKAEDLQRRLVENCAGIEGRLNSASAQAADVHREVLRRHAAVEALQEEAIAVQTALDRIRQDARRAQDMVGGADGRLEAIDRNLEQVLTSINEIRHSVARLEEKVFGLQPGFLWRLREALSFRPVLLSLALACAAAGVLVIWSYVRTPGGATGPAGVLPGPAAGAPAADSRAQECWSTLIAYKGELSAAAASTLSR